MFRVYGVLRKRINALKNLLHKVSKYYLLYYYIFRELLETFFQKYFFNLENLWIFKVLDNFGNVGNTEEVKLYFHKHSICKLKHIFTVYLSA